MQKFKIIYEVRNYYFNNNLDFQGESGETSCLQLKENGATESKHYLLTNEDTGETYLVGIVLARLVG